MTNLIAGEEGADQVRIRCWSCIWNGSESVDWIQARRDMRCPMCDSVIVLNTALMRREIKARVRLVAQIKLHVQPRLDGVAFKPERQPVNRPAAARRAVPALALEEIAKGYVRLSSKTVRRPH